MKENDLIEDNKLIAEFMGLTPNMESIFDPGIKQWLDADGEYYTDNELKYHSSWDWLMPVVEKIESLDYFCMINRWTSIYSGSEGNRVAVTSVEGNPKIMNTFIAVVIFIEYYNKIHKNEKAK